MSSRIDELFEQAAKLEHEVERELNTARDRWHYRIESGRIRFEQDVRTAHQRLRHSIPKYLSESNLLTVLVSPVIYSLVIPIAILDLWVTVYQWACFPVYDVDRVRRSTYVVFDRQHLAYLNAIEKVNCLYCAYANGVFAYVREVAGRTEQYWCPIRHARRVRGPHPHYREFVEYGDAKGYQKELPVLRARLHEDGKHERPPD